MLCVSEPNILLRGSASSDNKRVRCGSPLSLSTAKMEGIVLIDSESASTTGFLSTVEPLMRRQMLAIHEAHCHAERESEMERRIQENEEKRLKREREWLLEEEKNLFEQQLEEWSSSSDQQQLVDSCCSGSTDSAPVYDESSEASLLDQLLKDSTGRKFDLKLIEPWILRTSIYDKFIAFFQGLYNRHDATALMQQLFQPCCSPDMTRELKLWTHKATNKGLENIEYLVNGADVKSPTLSLSVKPKVNALRLVGMRRVFGSHNFFQGYKHMFDKLPDCIMLFHPNSTKVMYSEDTGRTVVVAPYTYLFTALVPHRNDNDGAIFPCFKPNMKAVEAECNVWYVTRYNSQGRIESDCFHITITGCSDPTVTQNDIVQFVGLEGLTISDPHVWD